MVCKLLVSTEDACDQFVFQVPDRLLFAWQNKEVFDWGSDSQSESGNMTWEKSLGIAGSLL